MNVRAQLQQLRDALRAPEGWGTIILELTEPRYAADGTIIHDDVQIIVTDDDETETTP